MTKTIYSQWKVHTQGLLTEIVNCSGQPILEKPINILGKLLAAVGERAAELNDPKLNALMCQLTIYTVADPHSKDYDPEFVEKILKENYGRRRKTTRRADSIPQG